MRRHILVRCAAVLVVCVVIILAVSGGRTNGKQNAHAAEKYGKQNVVTPDFSGIGNSTLSYRDACESPKDTNDANLCIQREMLKTYQKQVEWAKLTFLLGVLGTSAVAISLFYTYKAVKAANRSAKAAEEVSFSNRPWINIEAIKVRVCAPLMPGENGLVFVLQYDLVNYGKEPAIAVRSTVIYVGTVTRGQVQPLDTQYPEFYQNLIKRAPSSGAIVFPRERRSEEGVDRRHGERPIILPEGRDYLFIHVKIAVTYRDSSNVAHITGKHVLLCGNGSTFNLMRSFVLSTLTSDLEDAAVIEQTHGNIAT